MELHIEETDAKVKSKQQRIIELETKREAHRLDLLVELRKQPKLPSRKSYIKRITQISKNSRKLDTDIQQILKETRQLQLESNTIQERLHRTYAMVNELVFREAKRKEVGKKAYGLLTRVQDIFGQISDTILATDRARREAAEWEAKLASLSSRSFDITKLQADLDYINKENELLEQLCHDRNNAKQNKCHDAAL
ncbi:hypothetical protein HPP92_017331 [Vanilla planifolia]|uniref:CCDC22 coiled-coil domain-containing protein n=1 Tax=Vanilla planifolia TaxID=51239 RepID=A0A835QFV4_VANPL|nr:hypothetical protein HPP92_017331 [Vanilla planifolia]